MKWVQFGENRPRPDDRHRGKKKKSNNLRKHVSPLWLCASVFVFFSPHWGLITQSIHHLKQPKGVQTPPSCDYHKGRVDVLLQQITPRLTFPAVHERLKRFSVQLFSMLSFTLPPAPRSVCFVVEALDSATCNPNRLKEFTVSDYMASALGRLEKHRGNATLHVFFYTVLIWAYRAFKQGITKQGWIYDALCSCDVKSSPIGRNILNSAA